MTTLFDFKKAAEEYVNARLAQLFEKLGDKLEDVKDDILKANKELAGSKISSKREKKEKDPNKPKAPQNGFMRFMDDCRKVQKKEKTSKNLTDPMKKAVKSAIDTLLKENNDKVSSSKLASAMGVLWKKDKLKNERKGYESDAEKDKKKFAKQMEAYKAESEEKSESDSDKKKKKGKSKPKETEDEEVEADNEDEEVEVEESPQKEKPKKSKGKEEKTCQATTGKNELCGKKTKDGANYCGRHKKWEEKEKAEEQSDTEEVEVVEED